jgi:uncharacterized protein (DUF2147 family)
MVRFGQPSPVRRNAARGTMMPKGANMHRFASVLVLASLATTQIGAQAKAPTPVGVWLHPDGRIEMQIAPCGDALCAKLIWFKAPNDAQGVPLVDLKNPDSALRARPLLGLKVLDRLRPNAEGSWEGGEVYNPDDGEDYKARMSIQDDGTLRVRGYVLIPLLGKTLVWSRVR